MQQRVLAVGHDAFRAGAQIVFLHVLRWLVEHHDAEIALVLREGGELEAEYAAVLPTSIVMPRTAPTSSSRVLAAGRRARHELSMRRHRLAPGSFDLVYANSVAAAPLAVELAAEVGCPTICHVHELEQSMRRSVDPAQFREVARQLDRWIAVSGAVQRNLVERHGLDPATIDLIPPAVAPPTRAADGGRVAALRDALAIPANAFVVGGSGTADWRKGPDVFVLVARAVAERHQERPVHLLWVGGEQGELERVAHDIDRLHLHDHVTFVGHQSDPSTYFALFDAFLLTSREDPFPLVCLEAAALGNPIICFEGAGGMPELVEDDAGYVVDYLDVEAAADRILALAASPSSRDALGRRAAEKVAARCSIEVVGPQVASVLGRYARTA